MFYASMIYGIHRHGQILSHEIASSNIGLFLGNLRNQIGTKEDYIMYFLILRWFRGFFFFLGGDNSLKGSNRGYFTLLDNKVIKSK